MDNHQPTTLTEIDPKQVNNTIVAESDFQACMNLLSQQALVQDPSQSSLEHKYRRALLQSISQHLEQICEPATDEAIFHYFRKIDGMNDDDVNGNDGAPKTFQMEDFDEDELLDTDATEKLQELRQQIQQQSERVAQIRNQVLEKSVELSDKQMAISGINMDTTNDEENEDSSMMDEEEQQRYNEYQAKIQEMNQSMQSMKHKLESIETQLPLQVGKWEKQLNTIQEGKQWSLSQTEQIVRHRTKDVFVPATKFKTPEERLLAFLA